MDLEISVYATVYNNAYVVKDCVESLFRALPDIDELVVVDNYSSDGTYEILVDLSHVYPVKVFRYRCSRGLGRQIAFEKTSGRFVLYIDMDTVFDSRWGHVVKRLLNLTEDGVFWNYYGLTTRRTMERIGGWKNMNYGEDWELVARAIRRGVKVQTPLVPPFSLNLKKGFRSYGEYRYVKSKFYIPFKLFKNTIDNFMNCKLTPAEILYRRKVVDLRTVIEMIISSSFTMSRSTESCTKTIYNNVNYFLPEELGLSRDWFLAWWEYADVYWNYIKRHVIDIANRVRNPKICFIARGLLMYRSIGIAYEFIKGLAQNITPRYYKKLCSKIDHFIRCCTI